MSVLFAWLYQEMQPVRMLCMLVGKAIFAHMPAVSSEQ